jgi:hypothetical protein
VKVAADFAHTAYVLAFDDAVVSAALADRYASGSIHGVNFLEKIVQLPLHLPPVSEDSLRELAIESLNAALKQAEIELSQKQVDELVVTFQRAVVPRLKTPRVCKRYGNAAMFALPMIGDETSPVDLLLIEAMRIFYPPLYEWVRANRATVLGIGGLGRDEERVKLILTGFSEATTALDPAEKDAAKVLLTFVFPRTESAWQNKGWPTEWDRTWAKQKRIASVEYFDRYFTYAIPVGDISDAEVDQLVGLFGSESDRDEAVELAQRLVGLSGETLVQKLANRQPGLTGDAARNAALVVSVLGDEFADTPGFARLSTMERAALLVSKLMQDVEAKDRAEVSKALLEAVEPLVYALELFRWMNTRRDSDGSEARDPADPFDVPTLGATLAARIADYWAGNPAIDDLGRRTGTALYVWQTYGEPDAVESYFKGRLQAEPDSTIPLIATTLGRAWSSETGIPQDPDFGREGYNTLAEYGLAPVILEHLLAAYGDDVGEGDFYKGESMSGAQRLAHQFAYIHRKVIDEQPDEPTGTHDHDDPEESTTPQL